MAAGERPAETTSTRRARDRLSGLIESVAGGDREALRQVYALTNAKLFGIVKRVLRDEGTAEDVLQEVYLTLWRRAEAFERGRASPITWLSTMARNKAIDRLRSGARARAADPIESAPELADPGPLPDASLSAQDRLDRLNACLDGLPGEHAGLVREAFFGDVTYLELSRRDGIPLGTVKSRIRRSLLKLRECLGEV